MIANEVYAERLTAVRTQLTAWQVEAVLITNDANRRWLSGFTGSTGKVLVTASEAILIVDSRYWEQAAREVPHCTINRHKGRRWDIGEVVHATHVTRIGIEAGTVTLEEADLLNEIEGITWVPLAQTVESLRQVKAATEVAYLEKAAEIADMAMMSLPDLVEVGMSEKALAWQLERMMREAGADDVAFEIIVAFGSNSALPHHSPSDRQLAIGDIILVDMGAKLHGYHSDMTRTFYFGKSLPPQFVRIYEAVKLAKETAVLQMRPNMTCKGIDDLARDVIVDCGYGEQFGHGLGHGAGLEIHETPFFSEFRDDLVPEGVVVTIEPGIYLPEWGGVRLEDLGVLTETGVRCFTQTPHEPLIMS